MSVPRSVEPLKNSTFVIEPSESDALAARFIVAGAAKEALFAGAVMETVGGTFGADTTTLIAAEVVEPPELSVAFAVSDLVPTGALT
ncbi:MAG: hypothetical protein ACK5UX_09660 [Burkholderiales bacterium]